MNKSLRIYKRFVTCCGIGCIPWAPGTFGSLLGACIYFALYSLSVDNRIIDVVMFLLFIASIPAISRYIRVLVKLAYDEQMQGAYEAQNFGRAEICEDLSIGATQVTPKKSMVVADIFDPTEVVIDEVFGQMLTLDIIYHYDINLLRSGYLWWIIAFVTFRLFDILKPFPVGWIDRRIKNAWGVMLDDTFAGILAAIVVCMMSDAYVI
ncbi:Phosphatidylglycerophosphatase A [Rickettsiales endosymbiont of Paramecium tredecaurelia]|uniref:phosphatidylglycerophosphatase A family protein n=1 Tax=Candidatus Sarmatiella mevalonica TaxID=2770581 RepID=UPI001924F4FA|nr:phosphatidylglycerophosphatase A [Candidatus Sarmatiella mevalonica]MBL3284449.1 Phosphatidylglycerophosphatase A [Candidatus Sarmatiella mevalonica]